MGVVRWEGKISSVFVLSLRSLSKLTLNTPWLLELSMFLPTVLCDTRARTGDELKPGEVRSREVDLLPQHGGRGEILIALSISKSSAPLPLERLPMCAWSGTNVGRLINTLDDAQTTRLRYKGMSVARRQT
jgi:hypothetical protein